MQVQLSFFSTLVVLLSAQLIVALPARASPCLLGQVDRPETPNLAPVAFSAQIRQENGGDVAPDLRGEYFEASFEVKTHDINAKPILGPKEYPYMYDVVEVFISSSAKGYPYFEIELSPFDQTFEVKIVDPHHPFIKNYHLEISTLVTPRANGWRGDIRVPLKSIGWDGQPESLIGNAYSVLGRKGHRHYWSAFPLPQTKRPNFHQPQSFLNLLTCSPGEPK